MKATALILVLSLSLGLQSASAESIGDIATLRGKTYRQCEIVNIHPDGISFTHANGAAKVLFTDLPAPARQRFGYDPAKAAAYEQEIAEQRLAEKQARLKRQQELGEALALAQQIELARLRGIEVQARAAVHAAAQSPSPTGLIPLLPPLGLVHQSQDYRYASRNGGFGVISGYPAFGFGYPQHAFGYRSPGYGVCRPGHGYPGGVSVRRGGTTLILRR